MTSTPATYRAGLAVGTETAARHVVDILTEVFFEGEAAVAAFEGPGGRWDITVHFADPPDQVRVRDLITHAAGEEAAKTIVFDTIEAKDWVKATLEDLVPVRAGRFVVHGHHDRARVPSNKIGIEIEAALAFGTGHHGTTRGCLLALDGLTRRAKPRHILDLGTGTGVLAIAAAKALRMPVLATDIDRRSALSARENARMNGVGHLVKAAHAAGLSAPVVRACAPFDLVMANILLGPLQRLSAPIARQLMPNATLILSGLLAKQKNAAVAAYRTQGLMLERSFVLDGWATLVMVARAS